MAEGLRTESETKIPLGLILSEIIRKVYRILTCESTKIIGY